MSIIDKLAKKVQDFSGETERRELVEEIKLTHETHVGKLHLRIEAINRLISSYNRIIQKLNTTRQTKISKSLILLHDFLDKFGTLSPRETYQDEAKKDTFVLPKQAFKKDEEYIDEIDLTKDEIFSQSFSRGVWGTKKDNRSNNLSVRERIGEYKIKANAQLNYLRIEEDNVNIQSQIAELYSNTVHHVHGVIEEKVIPELELAQAFLEAEGIKNYIVSNETVPAKVDTLDIRLLQHTQYAHHYQFIKNTFLFYVLSEKIYSTPILSKLINQKSTKSDFLALENQVEALQIQERQLVALEDPHQEGVMIDDELNRISSNA